MIERPVTMYDEIHRLEQEVKAAEERLMEERNARVRLSRQLDTVSSCGSCHWLKRLLCFFPCPAVEARMEER